MRVRRAAAVAIAAVLVLCGATCRDGRSTSLDITVENSSESRAYTLYCDPSGGSHPDPGAACLALEQHHDVMLSASRSTCIGGILTLHIRVVGTYRNERVDGQPDACAGNPEAERLWLANIPRLERR